MIAVSVSNSGMWHYTAEGLLQWENGGSCGDIIGGNNSLGDDYSNDSGADDENEDSRKARGNVGGEISGGDDGGMSCCLSSRGHNSRNRLGLAACNPHHEDQRSDTFSPSSTSLQSLLFRKIFSCSIHLNSASFSSTCPPL